MSDLEDNCWRLHVRGQTSHQIARACEMSVQAVELIVQRRLAAYAAGASVALRGHVEKLIDEVNEIRQAAWAGWNRSQVDKVKTVEKTTTGGTQDGKSEETISTEGKEGDSPFLRILVDCNRRESALRGIERPNRVTGQSPPVRLDLDELIEQVEVENEDDAEPEVGDPGAP